MSPRQLILRSGLLIVGGMACWFIPLFHIRPLRSGASEGGDARSASSQQASGTPLKLESFATAGTEITRLWDAFDADASQARSLLGRQAGLGGAWYFCVRGQAVIQTLEENRVVLSMADRSRRLCFELGVVVDNTVREAVGVKASNFANSQEFNAVSSELNRQVESEVIAANRALLKPGVVVDFVGCAKISSPSDLDPLCLIPIHLEIRNASPTSGDTTEPPQGGTSP